MDLLVSKIAVWLSQQATPESHPDRHIEAMAAAFNEPVEAVRRAYQIATHPFHLAPRLCVD